MLTMNPNGVSTIVTRKPNTANKRKPVAIPIHKAAERPQLNPYRRWVVNVICEAADGETAAYLRSK